MDTTLDVFGYLSRAQQQIEYVTPGALLKNFSAVHSGINRFLVGLDSMLY